MFGVKRETNPSLKSGGDSIGDGNLASLEKLVKKYPDARIVGHRDLDDKKFCPSFDVRKYLLNEDIPNYKFQDGLTSEADLEELRDDGVI